MQESAGSNDIPEGMIYGFFIIYKNGIYKHGIYKHDTCKHGYYYIVHELPVSELGRRTMRELREERKHIKHLPG